MKKAILSAPVLCARCLTVISIVSLSAVVTTGQNTPSTPERTPDGRPDLQGVWSSATMTPLERPKGFEDKPFFTEDEAKDFVNGLAERLLAKYGQVNIDTDGEPCDVWGENRALLPGRRASLIVDPPNGSIPLTAEARQRIEARPAADEFHLADPEALGLSERCLMWGGGPPLTPVFYNNNFQIVQTSAYVVIATEMIHDARVIPLDGRPHLPSTIRRWQGDPRGRWDGDTFVVDTTNFTTKTHFQGASENLHIVERFTRRDAKTLLYEYTIDDPVAFTRPWTASQTMIRTDDRIFEYACHEGNQTPLLMLRGARAQEQEKP